MIILDVETTGFDFSRDSILSIGAVDFYEPLERFYGECRVPIELALDAGTAKCLEYNGFSIDDITEASKAEACELAGKFIKWARDRPLCTIAGLNPYFDMRFVENAARSGGLKWPFGHRTVDLHTLFYDYMERNNLPFPMENGSSQISGDFISSFVGIPPEPRPHNALNGAIWETEALYRLRNAVPYLDDFKRFPVPLQMKTPLVVIYSEEVKP